jgi:hypothetical protein
MKRHKLHSIPFATWVSNLFKAKAHTCIVGWFTGRTWKNDKWYT